MSDNTQAIIPITVELSGTLSALASAKGIQAFERRLASELSGLVEQLGLSGRPSVEVRSVDGRRAVRVRVHETIQPYEPNVLKGSWLAVVPAELRGVPENQETIRKDGFPDGWLTDYVSRLSGSKPDLGIVFEYLTRLVNQIIAARPGCLVGPAQVAVYLQTNPRPTPEAEQPLSTEMMSSLLKSLLNLGVSVSDQPLVWETINIAGQAGRSVADIVESVFTQLRSPRIEIHVHPEYLNKCLKVSSLQRDDNSSSGRFVAVRKFVSNVIGTLGQQRAVSRSTPVYSEQVDKAIQASFRASEADVLNELGHQLPELIWVASSEMPDGLIAIKINDQLSPPILGLQPGEMLVNTSVEELTALNVPGRPANDPAGNAKCALVDEAHKNTVQQGGFRTLDISSFIPIALYSEVKRRAAQLIGIEDTEYQLAGLKQLFPKLVQAVTARFSVADVTRVMRGLAAEGLSLRDTRLILERMLQFDTITITSADLIPLDERLGLGEQAAADAGNWRHHCSFVRRGLKYLISQQYSYQQVMVVYTVDLQLQSRAEAAALNDHLTDAIAWLDEAEQEALKDSIWTMMAALAARLGKRLDETEQKAADDSMRAVIEAIEVRLGKKFDEAEQKTLKDSIFNGLVALEAKVGKLPVLTTVSARSAIRELLAAEIPDQPVISFAELTPEITLNQLGTVKLDG